MITSPVTDRRTTYLIAGHEAKGGFCPVCGSVAPCYRSRRTGAGPGQRDTSGHYR